MCLLRRHRRWVSSWLVAAVLFTQWVTAAYACPKLSGATSDDTAAVTMASMPDCAGDMVSMDPLQPQLCKAHCEGLQQSLNPGALVLDAPPALAQGGALVGIFDVEEAAQLASAMPPGLGAGPPVGAPALYIFLLVLRT